MEKKVGVNTEPCSHYFSLKKVLTFPHFPELLPACHHTRTQSVTPALLNIQICEGSFAGHWDWLYWMPWWGLQGPCEVLDFAYYTFPDLTDCKHHVIVDPACMEGKLRFWDNIVCYMVNKPVQYDMCNDIPGNAE